MIKIFYKNKYIILSKKEHSINNVRTFNINNINNIKSTLINFMVDNNVKVCNVFGRDDDKLLKLLKERIPTIVAGGGIVMNSKNKFLFIYRNKKWDLPKGKLDYGEKIENCAVREVSEETGIDHNLLKLKKIADFTYHFYFSGDDLILKETYWFKMKYIGEEKLVPQKEEGITKVEWFDKDKVRNKLEKTYPALVELIKKHIL